MEVQLSSFLTLTSALEGVCGQHHDPAAFTTGKDPVPIVQEAGWAMEPVWVDAENLAPPGFDPRTFQPVASRYPGSVEFCTKIHLETTASVGFIKISNLLKDAASSKAISLFHKTWEIS